MTSPPATSVARRMISSAQVPLATAIAFGVWWAAANAASNFLVHGPSVSAPVVSVSVIAAATSARSCGGKTMRAGWILKRHPS